VKGEIVMKLRPVRALLQRSGVSDAGEVGNVGDDGVPMSAMTAFSPLLCAAG
jgi:hypothetical protein